MAENALVMTTCYDASFARLCYLSEAFDYLLVGDSVGMVLYGFENTQRVSLEMMVDHTAAVKRAQKALKLKKYPEIIADLPINTYETEEMAIRSSQKLLEAGGDLVKLEGPKVEIVSALNEEGIRVCGHLGLTPQTAEEFKVQGRKEEEAAEILKQAKELELAGCELLVLEMIPAELAKSVTQSLAIPTIGIGAGVHCGGQVLVSYDLLGLNQSFSPKFLRRFANLEKEVQQAFASYASAVRSREFPAPENSFSS